MPPAGTAGARRFLHCCYCCDDAPRAVAFLTDALGLTVTMRTRPGPFPGETLGFDRMVEADVRFAHDRRGPRVGPAIEVQGWIDPPAEGQAHIEPHSLGIQAIGVAVGDEHVASARARRAGATPTGAPGRAVWLGGGVTVSVRDGNGITFDLGRDTDVAPEGSRLAHLRVGCRDLDRSVDWYERLGFTVVERHDATRVPAGSLGLVSDGLVRVALLRLPDEPFVLVLDQWLEPPPSGQVYGIANHRGIYRFALAVDNLHVSLAALDAYGIAPVRGPAEVDMPGTNVPPLRIAFLADPDGIPVELVERPRSAFR